MAELPQNPIEKAKKQFIVNFLRSKINPFVEFKIKSKGWLLQEFAAALFDAIEWQKGRKERQSMELRVENEEIEEYKSFTRLVEQGPKNPIISYTPGKSGIIIDIEVLSRSDFPFIDLRDKDGFYISLTLI